MVSHIIFTFSCVLSLFAVLIAENQGFLTPEDCALFYKQGYVLKRECIPQLEMENLHSCITAAIDRALNEIPYDPQALSYEEQTTYIDGSRIVYKRTIDRPIALVRINGCSGMAPSLLDTVRSEKMMRTFFELLGTNDLEHLISQIHPKLPGDGVAYPRHRNIEFRTSFDPDWQDVQQKCSYAICIIPIDPMTQENGGLWIDRNNYPEPQGSEEERVWIHAKPGDLFFMHPNLYHGSGPNSSTSSRKTLLTGFCTYGANHRTYPGVHVNTRLTLTAENTIELRSTPWSQHRAFDSGKDSGH